MSTSSVSKTKKLFTLKTVLDGLRGSGSSSQSRPDTEIEETLRSEHFNVTKTIRHGFPHQPTALAFDPVQHLLAIGNRTGSLRIIGQAGVDCHVSHETDVAIIQILFLVNEGALVTVTSDDHLHLWNFRQKQPSIVHSLKFQREKVSRCCLPFQSKWLYVGTERGNVHVVNIESFTCSGYIINWNKTIELCRKTHPGPVVHISDNPIDSTKLLIGFESGSIVFWDLRTKTPEFRYNTQEALRSVTWQNEGKQFMCSHSDGSLSTWNIKEPKKAVSITSPHAKVGSDDKPDLCKPIAKVEWRSIRTGDSMVIFSGGMSYDRAGRTPSITVMTGKSTTVLEMEYNVVDFVTLSDTPWANDFQDPYAIVVLLQNDLVVIDLTTLGYPCFENPYPMDIHESPVTACQYYANCPMDIIPALYSTGKNQKKSGFSEKEWPIKGGTEGSTTTSYPEIIITGHADGSLKFWDASSVNLQFLYKLKTAKIFEKPKRPSEDKDEDPFAIQSIFMCVDSRIMCISGPTHCILFKFSKQEVTADFVTLEFSIVYEVFEEIDSPEFDFPKPSLSAMGQVSSSMGSYSSNTSDNAKSENETSVKARTGSRRWGPGFIPDLVCVLCWVDGEPPSPITIMSLNSSYGLLAFGNESGLAIVDYLQKTCLLNLGTPDLYGSMDPYQRAPRSPRSKKAGDGQTEKTSEDPKSPTVDQSLSNVNPQPEGVPTSAQTKIPVKKIPPPRPPCPKMMKKKTSLPAMKSPMIDIKQVDIKEENSGALNLQENYYSSDAKNENSDIPKAPPRTKKQTKKSLVHQECLDLPTSPKFLKEKSVSSSTDRSAASSFDKSATSSFDKSAASSVDISTGGSVSLSPMSPHHPSQLPVPISPPVINLPRSTSEVKDLSIPPKSVSCEIPARLNVAAQEKAKSVSTGDLSLRMPEGSHLTAGKTFSDPLSRSNSTELLPDPDVVHHQQRRLSDSNLPPPAEELSPEIQVVQTDSGDQCATSKNWLQKKMQKKTSHKKKKKKGEEEDESQNNKCEDDCDNEPGLEGGVVKGDGEESDDGEATEQGEGAEGKSPSGTNKSFFNRVSLKFKLMGTRKFSNDEEPDPQDLGAVGGYGVVPAPKPQKPTQDRMRVKMDVLDLTDDAVKKHNIRRMHLSDVLQTRRAVDKSDGTSFSRSRSSSMSSLDNVTKEAIQCLVFADSFTRKSDTETCPCLWVGTSLGSVIVIVLVLQQDQRLSQPVIVSPSGSLYRMKGAIVCMSFLDFRGGLIPASHEQWRESIRDNRDSERAAPKATRQVSVSSSKPKISPTSSTELTNDRQFAIICSEKQARVISLPSQTCAFKAKVTESSFVVRAEIVGMRDSVCLMCYVANGHILAFSLPSLKPLFDADFLPLTDTRVARTFCFSNNGHAMFGCSPTEIQKLTYSADQAEKLNETLGELFLPRETPEAPKQGFLKSLFGGGVSTLDREELFGESSGKASKGLARHIPGPGNMALLREQASASSNEFTRARLLVAERGEKLGELSDQTERMKDSGEQFASAAHSLMNKYKDKKWYQF